MLLDMLRKNPTFQAYPTHEQEVYARLANTFELSDEYLFLDPQELTYKTNLGNRELWQRFLSLDSVQAFIKQQMASITQIESRKALLALQAEIKGGNVQAVKHLNELSGILEQGDQNKVVILHKIERPKTIKKENV